MLSRIAESLFWIGRYVERTDHTARMVQTHLRLLAEGPSRAETDATQNLMALMGVDDVTSASQGDLLRVLCWDRREPTSISFSWTAARDNARRAREVIPLEFWESINTTWQRLPPGQFNTTQAYSFLDWTRARSALSSGIARSTMVRDDGWQFMSLGRSLEQADMTSRMVASAARSTGSANWPSVLRGCGGYDAFLRTHRGLNTEAAAAEFLIKDARFPRSVMHGLASAADCLDRVARANPTSLVRAGEASRRLGQLQARLTYTDVGDMIASLNEEMSGVQDVCAVVAETVSRTYFAAEDPRSWVTERTR